jgi:hypothetical protein
MNRSLNCSRIARSAQAVTGDRGEAVHLLLEVAGGVDRVAHEFEHRPAGLLGRVDQQVPDLLAAPVAILSSKFTPLLPFSASSPSCLLPLPPFFGGVAPSVNPSAGLVGAFPSPSHRPPHQPCLPDSARLAAQGRIGGDHTSAWPPHFRS